MSNELEQPFGAQLHQLVAHLIKNAVRIPPAVRRTALAFEDESWPGLPYSDKREIVRQIAEDTQAPYDTQRHFESYPQTKKKKLYARYLGALKNYKMSLGL